MRSIFIKTSQFFLAKANWCQAFSKTVANSLGILQIGHRRHWMRSSVFQTSHPSQKYMLQKPLIFFLNYSIYQNFHQKKKKSECLNENKEMADVFLNLANFPKHALLTLAPPSGYALNLKALIKVSKVSWISQLSYEILGSSLERKFDKTNFISPKSTPSKSPGLFSSKFEFWIFKLKS